MNMNKINKTWIKQQNFKKKIEKNFSKKSEPLKSWNVNMYWVNQNCFVSIPKNGITGNAWHWYDFVY